MATNGGPARATGLVRGAAAVRASRWRWGAAVRTAGRGRQRTLGHGLRGLAKCRATATCVRDPRPGEAPGDRRGSKSTLAGHVSSRAAHSIPAGGTKELNKFSLRDHAPPQLRQVWVFAAQCWRADGAHVRPWRAELGRLRLAAVWPAASPPASGGPAAGIRGLGSNVGSNAGAGTFVHSLCAGRSVGGVAADWHHEGILV
jgi:hypothetical protein